MLPRKRRNELFEAIVNKGLQPLDFKEQPGSSIYKISHKDDRFWFQVYGDEEAFKVYYAPFLKGTDGIDHWNDWNTLLFNLGKWLRIVKDEFDTPDLWAQARASAKFFEPNSNTPNEMFSTSEMSELKVQVRQLEQGLIALQLPAHAQEVITDTIKSIPEKASRFTKSELEKWFMGAIIGQITKLALSSENLTAIGHLLKTTFTGFFQPYLP